MKKLLLIPTLFLIFIFTNNEGVAQINDIRFRQVSPPGGFTLKEILCIAQDDLGYIWMGTSQGLIKYDSNTTKWFVSSLNDSTSLPSDLINNIFCDSNNQLWLATDDGLCIFNREQQTFKKIEYTYEDGTKSKNRVLAILKTEDDNLLIIDESYFGILDLNTHQFTRAAGDEIINPSKLYKDNSNRIWIGSQSGNVFRYSPSENEITKVLSTNAKVNSIYSENNRIYIGTEGSGAKLYNTNGEFTKQISLGNTKTTPFLDDVRVIKKDTYGRIWYGTQNGLYMDDGSKIVNFKPDDYPGLPHTSTFEIFEDKNGGLWFGTWSGGVALVHHSDNNFITLRHSLFRNSISDSKVTAFLQTNENELLIGTEVGGLNSLDLNTGKFDIVPLSQTKKIANIKSLAKDNRGGIWVGTFRQGLFYQPKGSSEFKQFSKGPNDGNHISSSSVFSLCAVDSGVWIGTFLGGIDFYHYNSKTIQKCFQNNSSNINFSNHVINSILSDSKSNLWLGTVSGILFKIHIPSGSISQYAPNELLFRNGSNYYLYQLVNHSIYHLWEHSSGNIWCGTNNEGISIFNPESNSFSSFDLNGLVTNENVYGILEDQKKTLWITTNVGLISYDQETNSTRQFVYSDGIQSDLFCPNAIYQDSRKNLYFGGPNGLTKINPVTLKINSRKPKTIIDELTTTNNKSIYPVYSNNLEISPIELDPEETTFRISFSADNYLLPEKNKYKYRLINYYDEWIDNQNDGTVLFTNLDAGDYIFEVIACNNDGIWSDTPTRLHLKIKNYWYQSASAYLIYFILLSGLLYFVGRFYFERIKLKRAVLLEKNQRENEEQVHEMKLKFFTNISHEFRTPLTLISWPLQRILSADNITGEQREELEVANRNSNRLLQLINQIIDLRKLETEKSKLNISKIDIIHFTKELQKGFSLETKSRGIDFQFESSYSALEIEADVEKLDTILYNLLSNAYKYVSEKGQIKVTISKKISNTNKSYSNQLSFGEIRVDDFIEIAIEDTGTGIDNEDLVKIFTRFEQGKQTKQKDSDRITGSGIGLAICKDYTLLHHGKISVQSDLGKGSRFTVLLPSKQKAQKVLFESHQTVTNLNLDENLAVQTPIDTNQDKKSQILVVEDNTDFSKLIDNHLKQYYQIRCASNGNEALKILKSHTIDLIVSDVMMPEMDGFELCSIVKTQLETSHIPVILLTALSSSENLIAGLDKGADAYLTKPFNETILVKQIENVLKQRRLLKDNFSKQFISQKTVEVSSIDNFFLNRVRSAVEKNISAEDFNMDSLAEELVISRSNLHRKIKALSGVTTSEFVNLVRIKKAVELVTANNYRFNEVAYQVGFSSQSYFNRCFKKVYNMTPKEYFEKEETAHKQSLKQTKS
ncbi:two-component regulator propeller domain-containing protein [Mangrovibacterium sp.]|uniref:hybrid sensor histidine kinase/response regulator transcription factor n=1 Tax=Mangrovibacterium sp. TaxID=1961364 RepID=UPI003567C709